MQAHEVDMLIRDFVADVLRAIERRRHDDSLMPGILAECRSAAERIHKLGDVNGEHVLIALQVNGRIDDAVRLGFFWLAGKAVEHDFDSGAVGRSAAALRDALMGRPPHESA